MCLKIRPASVVLRVSWISHIENNVKCMLNISSQSERQLDKKHETISLKSISKLVGTWM